MFNSTQLKKVTQLFIVWLARKFGRGSQGSQFTTIVCLLVLFLIVYLQLEKEVLFAIVRRVVSSVKFMPIVLGQDGNVLIYKLSLKFHKLSLKFHKEAGIRYFLKLNFYPFMKLKRNFLFNLWTISKFNWTIFFK